MEEETSDAEFEARVSEWLDILKRGRRVTLLRQVFSKMDADASGSVDPKEFLDLRDGGDEDAALPFIFEYLDGEGDGDGMLSLDEWVSGMQRMGEQLDDAAFEAEVAKWVAVLTKNQRTLWRSVFTRGHAHAFVKVARAAGATHMLFAHHAACTAHASSLPVTASAPTADWIQGDLERRLSNQGTAQCMVSNHEWFGQLPVRKLILTSPALYASETAQHMSGRSGPGNSEGVEEGQSMLVVDQLYPYARAPAQCPLSSPICSALLDADMQAPGRPPRRYGKHAEATELFLQKGFTPLRAMLDAEGGETAFGMYAEQACKELYTKFRSHGKGVEKATYTCIFGQAPFVNAIAHAVACAAGAPTEWLEEMLNYDLREAEAILVPLFGGPMVQHLKRPL
jgi:hypothetical protein